MSLKNSNIKQSNKGMIMFFIFYFQGLKISSLRDNTDQLT